MTLRGRALRAVCDFTRLIDVVLFSSVLERGSVRGVGDAFMDRIKDEQISEMTTESQGHWLTVCLFRYCIDSIFDLVGRLMN